MSPSLVLEGRTVKRRMASMAVNAFALALFLSSQLVAQTEGDTQPATPAEPLAPELTIQTLEARAQQISQAPDLDEVLKAELAGLYQKAVEQLRLTGEWSAKADEFDKAKQEAPARLEPLKAELAQPPPEPKPEFPAEASLTELEQRLAQQEAELDAAQKKLQALEEESKLGADRRLEMPAKVAEVKSHLDEVIQELTVDPPADEPSAKTLARRTLLMARKKAYEAELAAYENDVLSYEARTEILTARRDLAARDVARLEKLAKSWRDFVNDRRREEAEKAARAARKAQQEAGQKHPLVAQLAEVNATLAGELAGSEGLVAKYKQESEYLEEIKAKLVEVTTRAKKVKERVEKAGLTHPVALLVRDALEKLPNVRQLRRSNRARQDVISKVYLRRGEVEDERSALQLNLDDHVRDLVGRADPPLTALEHADVEAAVRELLLTRKELLEELAKNYESYFATLADVDKEESTLLAETEQYAAYLSERILWIRSTSALRASDLDAAGDGLLWMAEPSRWRSLSQSLGDDASQNPIVVGMALLAFGALTLSQRSLRLAIKKTGERAMKSSTISFTPTFEALVLTTILALSWPLLMTFVAWRLIAPFDVPDFTKAVAAGLFYSGLSYLSLSVLIHICRPLGLGDAHFGWSPRSRKIVRRNVLWFLWLVVPTMFLVGMLESYPNEDAPKESLGRLAFIVWLLCLAVFFHRVLRPKGGVFQEVMARYPKGWMNRLRYLWYPTALGLPLALAIAAGAGYYYTALRLAWRVRATGWLIVALVLIHELLHRWLLTARRKLALEQFRKGRAAQKEAAAAGSDPAAFAAMVPDEMIDLPTVSAQTLQLLRSMIGVALVVGLWVAWIDVLPALSVIGNKELWSINVKVSQTVAGAEGVSNGVKVVEQSLPITLSDVALAIVIVVLTIVAGKNIPGLLEITLLKRLPLDAGGRYAFSTISRYLITVFGLVWAFGAVGISWSSVQWLAAAITVGLGFGLQEIFANFVSGLILLFERPIRLGDTVTVGNVTGKVTRIRIRATTLTDPDRKELIVPNKEFITGSLLNWTLLDRVLRVVVRVGIAYGSDTQLAAKLLLQAAKSDPRILSIPEPSAVLVAFGNSSLDFELLVFVADLEDAASVRHDLNITVERTFREAGIEIAFPQQDIRIRSMLPVSVLEAQGQPLGANPGRA